MSIEQASTNDTGANGAPVQHGLAARLLIMSVQVVCYALGIAWAFSNLGVTASAESWAFAAIGGLIGLGIHWLVKQLTRMLFLSSLTSRVLIYLALLLLFIGAVIGLDRAAVLLKSNWRLL